MAQPQVNSEGNIPEASKPGWWSIGASLALAAACYIAAAPGVLLGLAVFGLLAELTFWRLLFKRFR